MKKRFLCKLGFHSWEIIGTYVGSGPMLTSGLLRRTQTFDVALVGNLRKCTHCDAESAILIAGEHEQAINVDYLKALIQDKQGVQGAQAKE